MMAAPPSLLDDVAAERRKYGPLMTANECGELCNAVAWKNRADGWGVSGKTSGNYATLHDGRTIAVDILHHRATNHVIDCLVAAGEAGGAPGPASPAWQDHGPNTQASRPWVAPIAPRGAQPGPTPTPTPTPPVKPKASYPGDEYWVAFGVQLEKDYAQAGQALNGGSGIWFARVIWDHVVGEMPLADAVKKQREGPDGWLRALGLSS
jgi:hypothetical protein